MTGSAPFQQPFNLKRWFAVLSFVTITLVAVAIALVVSHFLTREILDHDAILTAQFVQGLAESEGMQRNLGNRATVGELLNESFDAAKAGIDQETVEVTRTDFLDHFHTLPDVLLANVFTPDRRIAWSTNPVLIGKLVAADEELDEAFRSKVIVAKGHTDPRRTQAEQMFPGDPEEFFVENYIPLYDRKGGVAAIVEIYKEPKSLIKSIRKGHVLVWGCVVAGGFLCYLALFWIVRRAAALIGSQQQRLVESETLVVIGEMSSAVAHSIRNPLASIRSSAELGLEGDSESVQKNLRDIISQVDRIGRWIRDLLVFSRPLSAEMEPVTLERMIHESVGGYGAQLEKAKIAVDLGGIAPDLPPIYGNRSLFTQVFNSVISNAIEAMPGGGTLSVAAESSASASHVTVVVTDTGVGMAAKQLEQVMRPFYTTKRTGLGLGLALARRIMERFGGAIHIASREKEGTAVRLVFKLAR
jgi:histidine kinase/DNA gyrase B/HSP90-like ATPase/phospho-acceptor domain-containing protein